MLNLTVFFALLGSAYVKAACKLLVKLNLAVVKFSVTLKRSSKDYNCHLQMMEQSLKNICLLFTFLMVQWE